MRMANVVELGIKEWRSLWRDPLMLILIIYAFSASIYIATTAMPETLQNAPIAIVDEDQSPLSARVASAFYPPHFTKPAMVSLNEMDPGMDEGRYTFALVIPPDFQRDLRAGRQPVIQLNVDATRMSSGLFRQRLYPADRPGRGCGVSSAPPHRWASCQSPCRSACASIRPWSKAGSGR